MIINFSDSKKENTEHDLLGAEKTTDDMPDEKEKDMTDFLLKELLKMK